MDLILFFRLSRLITTKIFTFVEAGQVDFGGDGDAAVDEVATDRLQVRVEELGHVEWVEALAGVHLLLDGWTLRHVLGKKNHYNFTRGSVLGNDWLLSQKC